MKSKLRALIIASMTIGLLAGCGPTEPSSSEVPSVPPTSDTPTSDTTPTETPLPEKYSLMKNWSGHMEETIYEVDETTDKTVITYTDAKGENAGGWEYVARAFAFDAANLARFGEYKKLVITGKLDVTAGTDIVMVKLEGGTNLEAKFNFLPETKTYELGLGTIADWSTMTNLLFFVNRGTSLSGSGTITLDDIYLSKAEVVAENDIGKNLPKVPQDTNLYDGGDKLTVMKSWGYDNKGETTATAENGGWTFKYGETEKKEDWSYVSAKIADGTKLIKDAGFKRIHFKLQGEAGKNALIKFQKADNSEAKEFMIDKFSGEVQEFDIDISKMLDMEESNYLACIFPAAGRHGTDVKGTIKLLDCYLDKTEAVKPVDPNINLRKGDVIELNKLTTTEQVYTITTEGRKHTIAYNLDHVADYRIIKAAVGGEKLNELTHVSGTIKADVKVEVLLKPYDNNANEKRYTIEPGKTVKVDYAFAASTVSADKIFGIMIGTSNDSALKGNVIIENLQLDNLPVEEKPKEDPVNKLDAGYIKINNFYGYDKEMFTVANENNKTTIDFDTTKGSKNVWGENIKFKVDPKLNINDAKKYVVMTGKAKATVETSLIVKAYDLGGPGVEFKAEPMEAEKVYEIETVLPAANINLEKAGQIFIGFNDQYAKKGRIEIFDLRLEPMTNKVVEDEISVTNFYSVESAFKVTTTEKTTVIDIDKAHADGWENIKYRLQDNNNLHATVKGTFTSTVDLDVIFKPYDAVETKLQLKANVAQELNFTFNTAVINASRDSLMFIRVDGSAEPLKAKLTINNLRYVTTEAIVNVAADATEAKVNTFTTWEAGYELTNKDNVTTIKVNRNDARGWANIRYRLSGENAKNLRHVTATITSDVALNLIFKPFNDGANEVNVTLEAGVAYNLDKTLEAAKMNIANDCFIFIRAEQDTPLKATVTIANLTFAKVA